MNFNGEFYVQRQGVALAHQLAPVLCHIFLAKFDRLLKQSLNDDRVVKMFDMLIF